MIAKTFEVRDRMTFFAVLAVKLAPGSEADRFLLARAGYGTTPEGQAQYVQLIDIRGGKGESNCDPFDWGTSTRTFRVVHEYLCAHFDELESGAVVDVQFILGETDKPKTSERFGE